MSSCKHPSVDMTQISLIPIIISQMIKISWFPKWQKGIARMLTAMTQEFKAMTTRVCLQMYLLDIRDNFLSSQAIWFALQKLSGEKKKKRKTTTAPFLVQRIFCICNWRFTSLAKGNLEVFIYGKESSYDRWHVEEVTFFVSYQGLLEEIQTGK